MAFAIVLIAGAVTVMAVVIPKRSFAPRDGEVACTLEAKQCPDGSYVGRQGPNCAFAPCPGAGTETCGPSYGNCPNGYQCIQECGPPVVREGDAPVPYRCVTDAIAKEPRNCPICLAKGTNIATPHGDVRIEDVVVGMTVWSADGKGNRVESVVLEVGHAKVPASHEVVHVVLSDGRHVRVSPGHPTLDGHEVGDLKPGDAYDGAHVESVLREPYPGPFTYDLLPNTSTGAYWADGILLGSTLKH